jgi:hypothetical protein
VKRADRVVGKDYPGYEAEDDENGDTPHAPPVRRYRAQRDTEMSPKSHARDVRAPGGPQRDPVVFFTDAPSSDTSGQVSDNAVDPSGANGGETGVVVRRRPPETGDGD